MNRVTKLLLPGVICGMLLAPMTAIYAADEAAGKKLSLSEGQITLTAPAGWEVKKPAVNFIEQELAVPAVGEDKDAGRVIMMGAGGSVEANIERWIVQFTQPDGSDPHKACKQKDTKVAGMDVHLVDISGTYKDMRGGPFSGVPAVERPGYRMLGAIITSKKAGNYFIKFYGPLKTVTDNEAAFQKMIDSLEVK